MPSGSPPAEKFGKVISSDAKTPLMVNIIPRPSFFSRRNGPLAFGERCQLGLGSSFGREDKHRGVDTPRSPGISIPKRELLENRNIAIKILAYPNRALEPG